MKAKAKGEASANYYDWKVMVIFVSLATSYGNKWLWLLKVCGQFSMLRDWQHFFSLNNILACSAPLH
jgi:hypothetical protein